ncbi:2-dehydro-3-deoxygluconokinase [Nocardiopsis mwathae]|uniref:2-dehydro-3-deoxygluconokinase n=1 Tax=Nocardiopsis mwathae TaxID=1472723 RepID=A0A7X0D753_9ACTN|nr:sugar kinase [Nocardiopsis mwathae]MBB6173975.1 2-dehydro-3-deoxygluconokinase [Nocardiopsis mwathae]
MPIADAPRPDDAPEAFRPIDALCVGETMAVLTPVTGGPLTAGSELGIAAGGAESNVACGLARLGHRAAWLSRVGDDPLGRIVTGAVAAHGVDVSAVRTDTEGRPTGLYVKDPRPGASGVHYYRSGSAASAMGPGLADTPPVAHARVIHLSGITPALSPGCSALVDRLLDRGPGGARVSFDVNHRPALWPAADAAPVLLGLARRADVVFVGRDEAESLWGTGSADAVRALLPDVALLVVKDADTGATCYGGDRGTTFVPAPAATVVEATGAGDAFAAGFLSGLLDRRPPRDSLRLGHILAAAALRATTDVAVPPPRADRDAMLAADEETWPRMRLPAAGA